MAWEITSTNQEDSAGTNEINCSGIEKSRSCENSHSNVGRLPSLTNQAHFCHCGFQIAASKEWTEQCTDTLFLDVSMVCHDPQMGV